MSADLKRAGAAHAWDRFDTILLDMDGTLLDLAFDNFFWRELVPGRFARQRNITEDAARARIYELYASREGTLDWYCLDFWSTHLELDIRALKHEARDRIAYLPGAERFLAMAASSGKRLVLVTNAHNDTLRVKMKLPGSISGSMSL